MVLIFRKWQEWFAPVGKTSWEPMVTAQQKKALVSPGKGAVPQYPSRKNRSKVKLKRQVSKARSGSSKSKARNRHICHVAQVRIKTQGPSFRASPEPWKRSTRKGTFHHLLFLEKTDVSLWSCTLSGLILSTSSLCSSSALIQCSWCTQEPNIDSHLTYPHSFYSWNWIK